MIVYSSGSWAFKHIKPQVPKLAEVLKWFKNFQKPQKTLLTLKELIEQYEKYIVSEKHLQLLFSISCSSVVHEKESEYPQSMITDTCTFQELSSI